MKAIKFTEENLPLLRELVDNDDLIDARFKSKDKLNFDYIVIVGIVVSDEFYVEWFGISEATLLANNIAPFIRETGWFEIITR